ncbi:MAG: type II toxin-antitoxin system HicB family antitoxin [Nitrospirae bacterium]|nr:type II toxin-antitoxin system HicB family antitoxin [Nitrospirota bacterium]
MKNVLRYKGFLGSKEISNDNKCIHGKLLFIDDLVTYEAESPAQIEVEFKDAVDDYLDTCRKLGREPLKPFSGTFNVRIGSELHQTLAHYATTNETSINDVVKKALIQYLNKTEQKEIVHNHKHTVTVKYEQTLVEVTERDMQWKKEPTLTLVN